MDVESCNDRINEAMLIIFSYEIVDIQMQNTHNQSFPTVSNFEDQFAVTRAYTCTHARKRQ